MPVIPINSVFEMHIVVAGAVILLSLYCFLRNYAAPSVPISQSLRSDHGVFDYDQYSVKYNRSELIYNRVTHSLTSFGKYSTNRTLLDVLSILEYDYREIRYPIPFSQYYQHEENRYRNFGVKHPVLLDVETGPILPSTDPSAVMLIIRSDSKQFYSMLASVSHAFDVYNFSALTILDFGLTESDIMELQQFLQCRHLDSIPVYYRVFSFSSCPTWISMTECATSGGMSWKAISYLDATFQWNGITLWIDPGRMLEERFKQDLEYVKEEGLYSTRSSGTVEQWTHPSSIHFLKRYFSVSHISMNHTIVLGAYVLVDPRNETIRHRILYPYYQCAFTKNCIQPRGTTRQDHRGEEAILSLLVSTVDIPHAASDLSGRRPPYKQVSVESYANLCSIVCCGRVHGICSRE